MKKLLLSIFLLACFAATGQDYNKSSLEFESGLTKVRDVTSVKPLNVNIGYRYMTNTKFGAKIDIGYTNLSQSPIDYMTASLSGVINIGRLLEFETFTKNYTILAGVGGTFTHSQYRDLILHRDSNFHLSGFVENEFKVWDDVFVQIGMDVITGVNSRPYTRIVSTETTSIINFNLGLVVSLGKHKEHADFYLEEERLPVTDTVYMKPTINNYTKQITKTVNTPVIAVNKPEYVFFGHDSFKVDKQGLNAIKKIVDEIKDGQRVHLTGYASPPASNDYNFKLSKKRSKAVQSKLISLGLDASRIKIEGYGEVPTADGSNEDLSRCVELLVK